MPTASPGAIATAPGEPNDTMGTGANTPQAAASSGVTLAHSRHGAPDGSGSTA